MISLITLFFYFCHFFGCIFYYIARLNYTCTETAEEHALRVAANNGTEVEWGGDGADCTWILAAGLNGTGTEDKPITVTSKYVTSLYWAMMTATTVGYGDIGIMNISEQMYAVIIMVGIGDCNWGKCWARVRLGINNGQVAPTDCHATSDGNLYAPPILP